MHVVDSRTLYVAAAVLLSQSGSDTPGSGVLPGGAAAATGLPTHDSPLMQRKASQRITAVEGGSHRAGGCAGLD